MRELSCGGGNAIDTLRGAIWIKISIASWQVIVLSSLSCHDRVILQERAGETSEMRQTPGDCNASNLGARLSSPRQMNQVQTA